MSRRDIRKPLSFLLFLLLLGGAQTGWGQSLIPSTPGNYLQVTGSAATGDNDTFMVVFFSVPDDTSGPLYFAIDDPYLSGTSPDDGTDTAGGDSWDFYLVGGSGTFSSPISRQVTFGDIGEAANGSTLEELKFDGDGGGDNGWHYFSGVSPTQGEHIGNQYYFKVVAEAPNTDKNAFRLNVSKTDSGDPTGIAGVRAFAYAWTLALLNNTGRTWELYPFVPDSATGNITAFFVDFDNQDQGSVYNKTDRTTALASNLGNAATDSYSTAVTGQTNGTWYVELTETNGFPAINTALFYAEGSSPAEAYRVYASDYFPAAPDHVSATAEDGSAISNGSDLERVLLQLVDDSGDAVPYVRNIYLSVDGSAEIEATSDEAGLLNATERVVTTDSEGFAWVDVSDTVAENVTLTVITDGTTGVASQSLTSSRLPSSGSLGVNDAPQLSFIADAYPTASSAFGTSFIEGATQAIAAITIAEAGSFPSITAADGIRITIPTSKDVTFNTTPSSLSLSVSNGGGTVSYDNSNKTAVINVDTDFGTIDSLTVSGLELTAAADSDTSFFLEFSFDGDLVAEVSDNKLIIVQDTASTYTWTGSNTTWADQTNWDSGDGTAGDDGYPGESVITDNVVIPGGLSNYPVLASAVTINDLSIGSGGELDIGSTVLTVNGDSSNDGRLILSGAAGQGTGLGSFDTDSGTIEYSGGGSVQLDNCYNIEFSSGTYTLASDLTVKGDMTISGATVEDGGQAISISGDWNLSSGTFSANSDSGGTGTVEFVGSSIASLSGDTSFYNLTVQRAGKIIKFGAGDAFTVDGTLYVVGVAGNLINLISSNPETQWTITNGGGSETVQYVEVEDSAVGGTNDIAAYYSIDGDRNDTTSPGWNFFGTAWTWTGSISSAWGDEGNWDSGDESAGNDGTPGAGDSVTIPFTSRDPQLTGAVTVDDLTIEAWVEFDLNDYDLTVSGTLTNVGTLRAEGGGSVTASLNTDSGSVEYYGTGSYSHLAFGNSYYDLTISGGGSYALGAALTVENDLTVSSGTLDASGGADLLLGGDVDFSGGTFSKGTGTFTLQAADAQSLDPNAQDLGAFLVAGSGTAVTPSGDLIVDSLTIDSGASLTIGTGISIDVGSGALTNAGTLISSGAITAGDFSSTGTFTNAAANTISASGDVVISGSFGGTSTDNTLTMSGDGTRLDASENLGNLSVDPGSGNTVSLANNALVLDGDLAINSGSLNVEGFGITVSGSFSNSDTLGFAGGESTVSLPSSPIPGTVHYYGNSNTTGLVGGNSYTDLLFENSVDATSVTWTLSADLSVSDTLTVGSSTTLSTSTAWNNVTVSGDVDVSSGTFDAGGSGTIKVGGDVSFGTLTGGSGSTLELDGSSAQAIVPNGQSFGAVSLSGSGGVTLSGTGSFQSLTIAGGESLTLGGGAVTTGLTVNGTVTNGGSLYLNSDDAGGPTSLYMADGTTIANSGVLQVVSSTGAVELSSPGTTTLTGNELDVNGESLNLGGFETAIDHTLGAGDAVTLVGDVSFSGTLTLNGTGASLTTGDNTLTTGSLTITEGTVAVSGSGDVDVGSGAVTVGASGELTFNTTGSPALISGDFTSSGTVNNSQTSLVRASGNVEIDGSFGTPANSTIEMSGASATINTVVQAGSLETSGSAGVSAVTSNLKLAGDLTIALGTSVDLVALGCSIGGDVSGGGTLDGGSGSVDVNGDFTVGAYNATSGTTSIAGTTVSFTSLTHNSGEIDLDGTGTPVALSTGGQGLYSLTISNGSGFETVNVSGSLNLAGDLDIATGHTLGMGNNVLSVSGSTTNGGAITGGSGLVSFSGAVSGTGTITSGTGGVSFEGNYSGGVLVGNAAGTITFEGASTTLGTFTPNSCEVLIDGTVQLTSSSQALYDLHIGAGATLTPQAALTVNHDVIIDATGTYTNNGQTLTLGGSGGVDGSVTDSNGGTQDLGAVVISTATKSLTTAVLASSLTVTSQLSTAGNNVTASGDVDVSSGTLDAGGSGTIKVGGDVSFGTLTGGSGSTLELDGSGAQAIVPNGQSFGAVSLSGSGGVTLSGTGSFQSLTIAGGESLTLGGGAVTTGLTVNGTVTNGGSLYLNSDDAGGPTSLYMADGTTIANSGVLQVVSSTGAVELSSPGTTTLTGNELDVNGESLNLGGFETAIDHTLGAGDAVTLVGDVSFSGTLTLNGTGASLTTGDNTLTTGSLTITEGTVAVSGSGDVDVGSGAVTVGASGELTFNTTGSPALISGDFTSSGTVNNSQTSLVRASGNVEIDGSFGTPANSTVEMSGASATINTVVQAGSLETSGSAGVSAVTSNLKLAGDLTIALGTSVDLVALGCSIGGDVSGGGTLDGGSGSVDVNGDFTVGSYDATSGTTSIAGTTVSFTSLTHNSGEIDLDGTGTPVALSTGGQGLYSLTISNGSGFETVNVSGSLNLAGDLDIATGHTLGMGNNVLSVSGSTTNGGAITGGSGLVSFSGAVSGTGTITSGTGGVSFEGNYSGGVLVGNAAGTITFEGASTTLGTFTPNGTSVLFSGTATPQVFDPNANTLDGDVSINKDLQASILRLAGDLTLQDVSMTIVVGTLDLNAHTLTLNDSTGSAGNITLDSAGGLDMSTSGSALELQGDWSSDSASAFDPGSETVTFSGDHNPQSLASGGKSFYSITVTKDAAGDTLQLSDNLTQNAGGVLTVTTGELDLDGNTLTLGADLSLNSSDGTVTVVSGSLDGGSSYDVTVAGGSITHTTGSIGVLDFTVSGGTVTIGTGAFTVAAMSVTGGSFTQTGDNGGNTQSVDSLSVTGGSCSWDSGSAGGTLVFTGAPGADLTESSGSLSFGAKTVTGIEDIYITGGDLDLGTAALTSAGGGAGTYTINTSGTITDSGSTLTLNGDGTLSLDDDESIGDLVIGAAITFSDGGADPDVDTLSFSGGSLAVGGNAFRANSADVSGAVTVGNGGSFGTVGALTVNNGGSITASGSGIVTAGAVLTMNGTGTVSVEDGTMSVSAGGAALNGSGALSSSGAGNIDVTGNLVWTGASSDVSLSGGGQLLVSGNLTQDGSSTGEISVGAGGIAVNGDLSQAAAGNGNISAGAGGVSVGGVLTMYSTLSVTGGDIAVTGTGASGNNGTIETITSGSQSYAGTFTNSGTLTGVGAVSFGSDLINSGTLNMGSGIVSVLGALDGSGGTIDFNGTNDGELEVSADVTFTSGSSITNGDSGDVIRFTGAGAQLVRSGGHAFPSVEVNKSGGSLGLDTDNMTQATGATLSFGCSGATAVNLNGLSWTLEAAVDINDNVGFNVLAGTLDGGQALTVSGTGDLIHTSGRVEVSSYTHSGTGSSLFGVGDIAISGQLEVSDGSFTQTGDNGGNTQSVDSLSVTGGSCSWDSGSAGGTLVFTGAPGADLTESSGSLFFGAKTVTGIEDIYITGGNLDLGTAALTSAGGGAGIYTINTSGTITDLGSTLTLNGTGALTLDDDESIGALVIGADITFIDGGMDPDVNTLTVGSGSSLSCGASDFSTSGDAVLNGNLSFSDGNFIAGGNLTLSSGGTLDVSGAGAVTVTGTTIAAGTVVIGGGGVTLVGDADLSGATIDFGPSVDRVLECQRDLVCSSATSLDNSDSSDTLIFSGEVEQNLTSAGLSLMSVSVESSGLSLTRVVPLDDTTIDGDLSVTADAEFSTGGNDVTLSGAMSLEGLTYPDCGVFELDGRETVSIGTMDIDSGIVRFVGDLTASGAVSATVYDLDDPSSDPANFYILELNATNSGTTFTLVKNTEIASEVRVLQGSFDLGGYDLSIGGSAPGSLYVASGVSLSVSDGNLTADGDVECDGTISLSGTVVLTAGEDIFGTGTLDAGSSADSVEINVGQDFDITTFNPGESTIAFNDDTIQESHIGRAYTFYNLEIVDTNGDNDDTPKIVYFPEGELITIAAGGSLVVTGAENHEVELLSSYTESNSHPATAYDDALYSEQWRLTIEAGGTADIDNAYVELSYSYVPIYPTSALFRPDRHSEDDWCYNWRLVIPVIESLMQDSNGDGKLDRIQVTVNASTPLNDDFSDFSATVDGYTVAGYDTGTSYDDVFYILLEEKPYLDTDATPSWWITGGNDTNDSLRSTTGTSRYVTIEDTDDIAATIDSASPVIGYTLAVSGYSKVFIHFSEPVQVDSSASSWIAGDFTVNGTSATSLSIVTGSSAEIEEVTLNTASALSDANIIGHVTVTLPTTTQDAEGNIIGSTTHRVSDLGLGIIEPVYARNTAVQRDATRGAGVGLINYFDDSAWLEPQEIELQVNYGSASVPTLSYDSDVPQDFTSSDNSGLWLPSFDETDFSGLVPYPNDPSATLPSGYSSSDPASLSGADQGSSLINFTISDSSDKLKDNGTFDFFLYADDLYHARVASPAASNWYRTIRPFSFEMREVRTQTGDVTILNNVINPDEGEKTTLHYTITRSGTITIQVFNLAGDLIDVLYRGRRSAGEYAVSWDGRNRAGYAVGRGIYFVRFSGPGIDEYRKVMVIR